MCNRRKCAKKAAGLGAALRAEPDGVAGAARWIEQVLKINPKE